MNSQSCDVYIHVYAIHTYTFAGFNFMNGEGLVKKDCEIFNVDSLYTHSLATSTPTI